MPDIAKRIHRASLEILNDPGVMFGTMSPIMTAGDIVQANAECLAGACIIQVSCPGMPVVCGGPGNYPDAEQKR